MHTLRTALLIGLWLGASGVRLAADERPARVQAPAPRCAGEPRRVRIAAVINGGEIELESGERLRLADLRLPDAPGDDRPIAWLRSLVGDEVAVVAVGGVDRWGRQTALVTVGGDRPIDLAEVLVGEGFALVDPGEREGLCRPGLLRIEAVARERRLGLWARPGAVLSGSDRDGLAASAGRFVVAEGRLSHVGERRDRTYLDFGRDWARDFSVSVPKRVWAALRANGTAASLVGGAQVRVRGLVEMRCGPAMEITGPDMLEIVPNGGNGP